MIQFVAEVSGEGYSFEVNAEDAQDAHATAIEHLQLIGMEEWIDLLIIKEGMKG